MAITRKVRFDILQRDGFKCRYCGVLASGSELHIDHVFPRSMGGGDEDFNLVAACHTCNFGKRAKVIGPIFIRYYCLRQIHKFFDAQPQYLRDDILPTLELFFKLENWLDPSSESVDAILFGIRQIAKGEEGSPDGADVVAKLADGMIVNLLDAAVPIARDNGWLS